MISKNPGLTGWAIDQRRETQARTEHHVHDMGVRGSEPIPGAGGVTIECEDNRLGRRTLVVTARPVLLGGVEVVVDLSTQAPDRQRSHSKSVQLDATPDALRDLARKLLEAADQADANRPRPKTVR